MKKNYYSVPCPFCEAKVNRACFEKSRFQRDGVRKWIAPHAPRIRAWKATQPAEPSDDFINNTTAQ